MNYTSIEQSKHLLELGLKPETADMCFCQYTDFMTNEKKYRNFAIVRTPMMGKLENKELPCWSVGALLKLMPKRVNEEDMNINVSSEYYQITYGSYTQKGSWSDWISSPQRETFLEALYDMVVWLLENNYLKKEK